MRPKNWEIVLAAVLVAVLAFWAIWPKPAGSGVTVTVDGEPSGTFSLASDRAVPIAGYGGFSLTLVVSGGQAHVEDSTCPDLLCQRHAPISRSGEQIICLPGRVVISVTGGEDELDAVTR